MPLIRWVDKSRLASRKKNMAMPFIAVLGTILCGIPALNRLNAAQSENKLTDVYDDLQVSYKIDHYKEIAESGPGRGENIYWHKCWVCHNHYQGEAPHLAGLFSRSALVTGLPVNDETVTGQIKNGGPGMPSFRTTLSDSDIADVVSYLHQPKCCIDGEEIPANPSYRAAIQRWTVPDNLSGGAKGIVRIASGDPALGIMVQLIAPNNVRTTVYTGDNGSYEFPKMQAGTYTLRIATPLEFKPYRRTVEINGATKFEDIVLEHISSMQSLPATAEIESQLSGEELLWNLPGTADEKEAFHEACGLGCHSFQQILKNRYDERSWRALVKRMLHRGGPLINPPLDKLSPETLARDEVVVKWLAKVRGPESKDGPLWAFPRSESGRAVVTEYELPRVMGSIHDVYGDANGDIWYTSHLSRNIGRLDPRTGIVMEYQIPLTAGALPGTHHVKVQRNGEVWFSEPWAHKLLKFDPLLNRFSDVLVETPGVPVNSGGIADFDQTADGFVWYTFGGSHGVLKIDPATGGIVHKYPFETASSYESVISDDGNFWAGSSPAGTKGNSAELLDLRTGEMQNLSTGDRRSAARRGGFDPFGNAWFAGQNGTLVELDAKAKRIREYWPPTPYDPYADFYAAMPDKNGEVWTAELHGKEVLRFNPRTSRWTQYATPEPYAHARHLWVDNSTPRVTVWYADYSIGRLVRIQPLE